MVLNKNRRPNPQSFVFVAIAPVMIVVSGVIAPSTIVSVAMVHALIVPVAIVSVIVGL